MPDAVSPQGGAGRLAEIKNEKLKIKKVTPSRFARVSPFRLFLIFNF
jgi:hypothetical protein